MRNEKEIVGLFGEDFIAVIKRLIKKTSLKRENIKSLSDQMEVGDVYESETSKTSETTLIYIFESMLDVREYRGFLIF